MIKISKLVKILTNNKIRQLKILIDQIFLIYHQFIHQEIITINFKMLKIYNLIKQID